MVNSCSAAMTFTLVLFYFTHMADTQFIGQYKTHQACIKAKMQVNPEVQPDAMACVEFTKADLAKLTKELAPGQRPGANY